MQTLTGRLLAITSKGKAHVCDVKHLGGPLWTEAVVSPCPPAAFHTAVTSQLPTKVKVHYAGWPQRLKIWKLLIRSSALLIKDAPLFVKSQPNYQMSTWGWLLLACVQLPRLLRGKAFFFFLFHFIFTPPVVTPACPSLLAVDFSQSEGACLALSPLAL